jgi:hypothetical protein
MTGTPLAHMATGAAYQLIAPSGVNITPAPAQFSFNGLGQPSGAVSLNTGGGTITVQAETGYVQ